MAMTHLTTPSRWFRRSNVPAVSGQSTEPTFNNDLARIHDEMNRLVDRFFGDADWWFSRPSVTNGQTVLQPQLDILETRDEYRLSVELPGIDRDNIDLSVDEDALIISARKEQEHRSSDDDRFTRVERHFGRFERMLTLPVDADSDKISAELKNGVLEVTIPRRDDIETTRGRKVEIKTG